MALTLNLSPAKSHQLLYATNKKQAGAWLDLLYRKMLYFAPMSEDLVAHSLISASEANDCCLKLYIVAGSYTDRRAACEGVVICGQKDELPAIVDLLPCDPFE